MSMYQPIGGGDGGGSSGTYPITLSVTDTTDDGFSFDVTGVATGVNPNTGAVATSEVSVSDTIEEFTIDITVPEAGVIEYDYTVDGSFSIGIKQATEEVINLLTGGDSYSANFSVYPARVRRFRNDLEDMFAAAVSEVTGIPEAAVGNNSDVNDDTMGGMTGSLNSHNENIDLEASLFGVGTVGERPYTGGGTVDFTPATIAVPEFIDLDILDELPTPIMVFEVAPRETLQSWFGSTAKVEIELPYEAFINVEVIDFGSCMNLHPNIGDDIQDLEGLYEDFTTAENQLIPRLEEIKEDFEDGFGVAPEEISVGELTSIVDTSINTGEFHRVSESDLEGWAEEVMEADVMAGRLQGAEREYSSVREAVEDNVEGDCLDELLGLLDDISGLGDRASELVQALESLESDLWVLTRVIDTDLSCGDVSQGLRNSTEEIKEAMGMKSGMDPWEFSSGRIASLLDESEQVKQRIRNEVDEANPCRHEMLQEINDTASDIEHLEDLTPCDVVSQGVKNSLASFEEAAEMQVEKNPLERTSERVEGLLDEYESVVSDIESGTDPDNPCREQLLNEADNYRDMLDGLRIIQETDLPCQEQYPDVHDSMSRFEDLAGGATPSILDGDVDEVLELRDNLEGSMERVEDGDCREEFRQRFESSLSDVESVLSPVRIGEEIQGRAESERQEILDSMEKLMDGIDRPEFIDPDDIIDANGL